MINKDHFDTIIVPEDTTEERLDTWLTKKLSKFTRSQIQKAIKSGVILLNEKPCQNKQSVYPGDSISFLEALSEPGKVPLKTSSLTLEVLHEDEHLIVINKPAGLSVHPSLSDKTEGNSVVEALLSHCQKENLWADEVKISERPGVVHRLDKNTTGALVWAKNPKALEHLKEQFKNKSNKREYLALLDGTMGEPEIICESWLTRDPKNKTRFTSIEELELESASKKAKWAKTFFRSKATYLHKYTLAYANLSTGRTHQIRVHAKEIQIPVLGDPVYNVKKTLSKDLPEKIQVQIQALTRQMLHAETLGFIHPESSVHMEFIAELPKDFKNLIDELSIFEVTKN